MKMASDTTCRIVKAGISGLLVKDELSLSFIMTFLPSWQLTGRTCQARERKRNWRTRHSDLSIVILDLELYFIKKKKKLLDLL